jgi:hypothetical protein
MSNGVNGHDQLFILNNLRLRIPPTAIKITKDSLNYQWQTLRTNTSQKTKSGHSTVTIEFTVPFVSFDDIHTKLKPLIAQLRYMPFCFAENQFLRENLFPQETQSNSAETVNVSTIVLAFRAASITARNDTPGTIWVNFQFAYFNYLPYTPYWQYKLDLIGDDSFKSTTFPSESKAWEKFVAPVVNKSTQSESPEGQAKIKFLELRTAPTSSVETIAQTKQILSSISQNQKQFFDAFRSPTSDTPDGAIVDAVRTAFPKFKNQKEIAAADLLGPLLMNAGPASNPLSKRYRADGQYIDQNELKKVFSELDQRLEQRQQIESGPKEDLFELVKALTFQDNRGQGFGVYKKIRGLSLNPNNGITIEGITISVQNILASIPIIGHRYATFQHIGSIDATVILDMKVTNDEAMSKLSWFYDTANDNALNNRHIPQGLQTIRVDNDVLALFNLQEFITQDMETCTIEGQPGTYSVKLSLIESGLKQNDKVDDASDKFSLEFASQDDRVAREIVRVIQQNIKVDQNGNFISNVNESRSSRFAAVVGKYLGTHAQLEAGLRANGALPKLSQQPITDTEARLIAAGALPKRKVQSQQDINTIKTGATSISSTSSLNTFGNEVTNIIFDSKLVATDSVDASNPDSPSSVLQSTKPGDLNLFNTLMALTEDDMPGITPVQELVRVRAKKDKQLNQELVALANKPLSDVLQQAKNKTARGAQIDQIRKQKALYQRINFDSSDVSGVANLVGLNENPPSTIEGDKFDNLLNNSTESLLKLEPFVKWNEFISSLTTAIVESDDIELLEFITAKKLVREVGLSRGLPAYQDFDLASIIPDSDKDDLDKLLGLDPDCYLLTPMNVDLDNFIDPALVTNAKRIALTSSQSAVNQINKFYQDSWFPSFISDPLRDRIKLNIAATIKEHGSDDSKSSSNPINLDIYYSKSIQRGTFSNAGSSGNNPIMLGIEKIDGNQTHASVTEPGALSCDRSIKHSFNPADLFNMQQVGNSIEPFQSSPIGTSSKSDLGRVLTKSNKSTDGSITDNPKNLASTAGTDLDTYCLARMIASEDGNANQATKVAIACAAMNECRQSNISISQKLLYCNYKEGRGKFGPQSQGRYAATSADPHEQDLRIAKLVLTNQIQDPTGGATQWSHPKAQDSQKYREAIAEQAAARGAKQTPRVLSFQDLIDARAKQGKQIVSVPGTDPDHIVFFKPSNSKRPFAYTPPTPSTPNPDTGINAGQNVADLSIEAFQTSIKNGQAMRMVRAFPAFKLYFIQDNSGNRRRFGLDDFYSYNSVVDITCVRSRKIPADLLEVTLTNVSGVLSNRRFQGPRQNDNHLGDDTSGGTLDSNGDSLDRDPNAFLKKNSKQQNTLASLMLQAGIDIELMLGYSNDPARLTTVFNGKIMEVEFSESDDLVRIICQSHAIELVQDMKGMVEPDQKSGYFISDARTDILLENMMAQPELVHFGRWVRSQITDTDTNTNRFLLTNKFRLHPTPQDDNIFVPPIEELRKLDPGFLFSDIKYTIYQTTIWDIFDEMTLRHPGWIRSAVPYKDKNGPRMTMFFGLPSQLYFAADPSSEEKTAGSKLRNDVDHYNNNIDQLNKSVGILNPDLLQPDPKDNNRLKSKLQTADFATERLKLAQDFQSVRPFRSYHLVTSKHHIIANNIRASAKGTHNTISVQYGDSKYNKDTKQLVQEGTDVLTLAVDAAMPDEEVRELFVQYPNCQSELMAKNYALSYLMRELKEVYRGELTIVGNPDIKPFDIIQIFDDYSDIMGPIEVEQVIHRFSQDTGFITEITPDLFVTSNEWVNMTANDMMSLIMESAASALNHGTPTTSENTITSPVVKAGAITAFALGLGASPLLAVLGAGLAVGGYFMMQKMVDFTSHGQPVVVHPLIHRGKPFVAGLPIAKLNNLWSTNKGEWFKEAFDGLGLWWDDFNDKLVFAVGSGSNTNLFSTSSVGPKF